MREIKFRGIYKHLSDGSLQTVYYRINGKPDLVGAIWIAEDEQFTGLKDKNGREIYEGDIVKTIALSNDHNQRGSVNIVRVSYFEGSFCFCFKNFESGTPMYPFNVNHTLEVIGNIHENGELLEK